MPTPIEENALLRNALLRKRLKAQQVSQQFQINADAEKYGAIQNPRDLYTDKLGLSTIIPATTGMIGGALGTPGGPVAVAGGGALGYGLGEMISQQLRETEYAARFPQDKTTFSSNSFWENANRRAGQGAEAIRSDLMWGLGVPSVTGAGSALLRTGGKLMGLRSPDVAEAIADSIKANTGTPPSEAFSRGKRLRLGTNRKRESAGIGAIDLGKPMINIISRVAGVIPIIGAPLRQHAAAKAIQIGNRYSDFLDMVAPSLDLPAFGVKITQKALSVLKARKAIRNKLYEVMKDEFAKLRTGGRELPVIPSEGIKNTLREKILDDLNKLPKTKIVKNAKGEIVSGGEPIAFSITGDKDFDAALQNYLELPDYLTFTQLEAMQKNLRAAAKGRSGVMGESQVYYLNLLTNSAFDAMEAIPGEAGIGDAARAAIKRAHTAHQSVKALEETTLASHFLKVDKNFFRAGFTTRGSKEVDELATTILADQSLLASPKFIGHVDEFLGPKIRKQLARIVLEKAANAQLSRVQVKLDAEGLPIPGSTVIPTFNAQDFGAALGFSDAAAGKANKAAFNKLFEGTGITNDAFGAFLRHAERVQSSFIGDPSIFLTRKLVLSGSPKSLLPGTAAFAGGVAAASGGLFTFGTFVLTGRVAARLMTTPRGLRILRDGLKPNITRQQQNILLTRLVRLMPDEDIRIEEQK